MSSAVIFITVGTTDFDSLIESIDSEEFLDMVVQRGCKRLVIQIGRGKFEPSFLPDVCSSVGVELEVFRFKPSLCKDMQAADLIICHAGAGSITEALSCHKQVMVVVNDSLMDNHQLELARAVVGQGYCYSTQPENLVKALIAADYSTVTEYPPVDYSLFPKLIDSLFTS